MKIEIEMNDAAAATLIIIAVCLLFAFMVSKA